MNYDEQEKGKKGQVQENHQKFLINPERLRKVSITMVVQGKYQNLIPLNPKLQGKTSHIQKEARQLMEITSDAEAGHARCWQKPRMQKGRD